jgi:tRNA G10  N-methylase Trm11
VAIPGEALSRLEDGFSALSGLRPDRRGGGGELCVLLRAEGEAFLLFRESTAEPLPSPFGDPVPGELPAHTARLLCECSSPRDDDLFLDPFAGTGSLPFHRALMAPFRLVFAQDIDPDRYGLMRARLTSKLLAPYKKRIFPKLRDARDLSAFEDGSVTAIVTDPPWGHWEGGGSGAEASGILQSFLDSARRVLAPEGHIVLLLSRGMADAFPLGDGVARSYRLIERLDVLISGRKASVVIME